MKTTFLAVTGLSPAIVTETLWALAKQKPAILPDRVIFITTSTGTAKLEEQLFTPHPDWNGLSVWDALRKALKAPAGKLIAESPAVISMADPKSGRALQLDDIRTPHQNAAAAEFIFSQVWNVVRDKDQRLIASVAGGRKTMGALLHSAVSLIGRSSDLITHILVDPPFDSLNGFFFPSQPGGLIVDRSGGFHNPKSAKPLLAEVPFVSLRKRFKELDELPGSFLALRDELGERLAKDAERQISILIDHQQRTLEVDGKRFRIRARALAILHFVLKCNERKLIPPDQSIAADSFNTWFKNHQGELGSFGATSISEEDIRRELNFLRERLKHASWKPAMRTLVQAPFRMEIAKD